MSQSVDIKILGGLPVTVNMETDYDENGEYVDCWKITHIVGKICKKPPKWLYNAIAKKCEVDSIIDKLDKHLKGN